MANEIETQLHVADPSPPRPSMISRPLHRFCLLLAFSTLALVVMGGLVTSHGVGMAVPDWPNTYGYNMFFFPISRWVGGIFYEHTHRLLASGVGFLTTVLVLWVHGRKSRPWLRWGGTSLIAAALAVYAAMPARKEDALVLLLVGAVALLASFFWPRCEAAPKYLKRLSLLAFLAVILQGVLGGLRVVLLRDEIGVLHAALAQLFFVVTCGIALFTSPWWQQSREIVIRAEESSQIPAIRWWFFAGTILLFTQLLIGATMRHQHAGLAIPDFPLAYGRFWPPMDAQSVSFYNSQRLEVTAANPITAFQIGLQMVHRILAIAILVLVAAAAVGAKRYSKGSLSRLAITWLILVAGQALLGAATIWSNKAADVATAHVMVGALSLALGVILSIVSSRNCLLARTTVDAVQPGTALLPRAAVARGGT